MRRGVSGKDCCQMAHGDRRPSKPGCSDVGHCKASFEPLLIDQLVTSRAWPLWPIPFVVLRLNNRVPPTVSGGPPTKSLWGASVESLLFLRWPEDTPPPKGHLFRLLCSYGCL